jgi:hypothetical protein
MTLSCALLCLMVTVACQRSVTPPAPTLQSKIVGKWTLVNTILNSTNYGVSYHDTATFTSADYLDFKADSTLSILSNGVAYNGKWWTDSAKLFITGTNFIDYPHGCQLPVLNQHNLQLFYSNTIPDNYVEQILNLTK